MERREWHKSGLAKGVAIWGLLGITLSLVASSHADEQENFDKIVALSKQAVALSNAHKYEEAKQLYLRILGIDLELDPRNSHKRFFYHQLALTFMGMENYRDAYDDETTALANEFKGEGDPTNADLYASRAQSLIGWERYADAEADFRRSLASKPSAYVYALLAVLYETRGMVTQSLDAWKSGADLAPDYKANYQTALDHVAQAKQDQLVGKTKAIDPDSEAEYQKWLDEAFAFQEKGDYDAAAWRYEKLTDVHPGNPSGYKGRADTLLRRNYYAEFGEHSDYNDALSYYDQAISLGMNTAVVWANRALVLYYLKDWERGRQSADKAVALDVKLASAWWTKALCESRLGLPSAETSRTQAIALDASRAKESLNPEPDSDIAAVLPEIAKARAAHDMKLLIASLTKYATEVRRRGRMAEWRAVDKELKPLLGTDASKWWSYGVTLQIFSKAPEEAKAAYRTAIALDPKNFRYRLDLATQQALQDDWDACQKTLDEATPLYTPTNTNDSAVRDSYDIAQIGPHYQRPAGTPAPVLDKFRAYLKAHFADAWH